MYLSYQIDTNEVKLDIFIILLPITNAKLQMPYQKEIKQTSKKYVISIEMKMKEL